MKINKVMAMILAATMIFSTSTSNIAAATLDPTTKTTLEKVYNAMTEAEKTNIRTVRTSIDGLSIQNQAVGSALDTLAASYNSAIYVPYVHSTVKTDLFALLKGMSSITYATDMATVNTYFNTYQGAFERIFANQYDIVKFNALYASTLNELPAMPVSSTENQVKTNVATMLLTLIHTANADPNFNEALNHAGWSTTELTTALYSIIGEIDHSYTGLSSLINASLRGNNKVYVAEKDNEGDTNGSASSTDANSRPVPSADPTTQISNINMPTENLTNQNIIASMSTVETAMGMIVTDKQAIETLSKMDELVKKITGTIDTNVLLKEQLNAMVTQITSKMEEKINLIENPENRMIVLDQFLVEIKLFKVKTGEPMTAMDKSVEDMVQKTANAFGTLKLEAAGAGEATKIDDKTLVGVIAKQTEALKKLTQIQQTYFDTSATRVIKKEIKLEIPLPEGLLKLKVDLAANQVGTLKDAKIDFLSVSNVSAEIKLPVFNLKPAESAQLVIEKMPTQITTNTGSDLQPKFVYDIEFLINNVPQEKFSKPITLAFNLVTFELQKESTLELSIFKLNNKTNKWEAVGGIVDPETYKIFVTRDNLSQYTVLKSKKSFSDADQSWAKAEINALLNKGIVSEAAKFEPQSALTRGEFAQWISKAYGLKVSDQNLPFKDVAKTGASYEAIAAVYQQGIIAGKSKTNFDPNGKVTQNEMAAVLGKLLVSFDNKEKSGKVTSKYLSQLKTTQVASWAEDDMALLMELGLNISGANGGDAVTKEAAASAFMKFYRS
jgi:hypothetical protein